jgi:hypothetical protein
MAMCSEKLVSDLRWEVEIVNSMSLNEGGIARCRILFERFVKLIQKLFTKHE